MQFTTMSTQDSQSQRESMLEIESEGSFISADREAITADTQRPKATSFFVTTLFPLITLKKRCVVATWFAPGM